MLANYRIGKNKRKNLMHIYNFATKQQKTCSKTNSNHICLDDWSDNFHKET
jgi:hypothetical protein